LRSGRAGPARLIWIIMPGAACAIMCARPAMAEYPRELVREHTLFDGRRVVIRPVRDEDERLERNFVSALSGENRYMRFQEWVSTPSEGLLRFLTHVDYERHVALVCVARSGDAEDIVGEARYVVNPDGKSCDFGIVIADAWHKSGIAGLLMQDLIAAARERGLGTMESQVLACNTDMLRFAHGLGFEVQHVPDDMSVVRIVKRLAPAAPPAREEAASAVASGADKHHAH
jgi:acetyltransferase